VASCAKIIRPNATIQLTSIEFVIGKPNTRSISTAFCGRLFSVSSAFLTVVPWLPIAADVVEGPSDCAHIVVVQVAPTRIDRLMPSPTSQFTHVYSPPDIPLLIPKRHPQGAH